MTETYNPPVVPFRILEPQDIRPGDVVLCFSELIKEESLPGKKEGYSHAAICYAEQTIAESAGNSVRSVKVQDLIEEYDHLAIMRNDEVWSTERLDNLEKFVKENLGKKFNSRDLKAYEVNREVSQQLALERIHDYFQKKYLPASPIKTHYFCSELVVAAFISVDIIDESAAVVFEPNTFLPEDLARDKLFGFFMGYMVPYEGYQIPADDLFRTSV